MPVISFQYRFSKADEANKVYDSTNFRAQRIFVDVFDHVLTKYTYTEHDTATIYPPSCDFSECHDDYDNIIGTSCNAYDSTGECISTTNTYGCLKTPADSADYCTTTKMGWSYYTCDASFLDASITDSKEGNSSVVGVALSDLISYKSLPGYHVIVCKSCVESEPGYTPFFLYDVMRHEVGHVLFQPAGQDTMSNFLYYSAHASDINHFMFGSTTHFPALLKLNPSVWADSSGSFPYRNDLSSPEYPAGVLIDHMYLYSPMNGATWIF